MKRVLTAAAFSTACLFAFNPAAPAAAQQVSAFPSTGNSARNGEVAIPLRVEAGQHYLMQGRIDTNIDGPGETEDMSAVFTYTLALDVEQFGRDGGVWRWSIENIGIESLESGQDTTNLPWPAMGTMLSAATRLMTDIDFVCRVDASGACVELLNWPDWRERAENLALIASGAVMIAAGQPQVSVSPDGTPKPQPGGAPAASPSPAAIAAVINNVTGLVLDGFDNRIAAGMMAMPMISGLQGQSLRAGVETPTESLIALPFGAAPIRYAGSITLESVDRQANEATFTRRVTLDQTALKTSLNAMAANLMPQILAAAAPVMPAVPEGTDPATTGQAMAGMVAAALATIELDYTENTRGAVDMRTGLVKNATTTINYTVGASGNENLMSATSTLTFGFVPGTPPRPRLGANAPR
ncbi:MAG: hypothetical protein ACOYKM_01680 [Caulobacterales bacterium]|jgi:hypothetical protein